MCQIGFRREKIFTTFLPQQVLRSYATGLRCFAIDAILKRKNLKTFNSADCQIAWVAQVCTTVFILDLVAVLELNEYSFDKKYNVSVSA